MAQQTPEQAARPDERTDSPEPTEEPAEDRVEVRAEDRVEGHAEAPPPPRPGRILRHAAIAVSLLGELLITAGIVLGLFVAYSLWWTNVLANQEAERDSAAIREMWRATPDEDAPTQGPEEPPLPPEYDPEDGIGFLHVPAMSEDDILVKEGTDLDTLDGGVAGSYEQPVTSAMPWDKEGNFSLASHRDGHGAKFHDIHKIKEGDPLVFETEDTWYIYRTYAILPETSKYNTAVLAPVPRESGKTKAGSYITLTTCTPLYSSRHRYIVWGELERTEPVDAMRTPPAELRQS